MSELTYSIAVSEARLEDNYLDFLEMIRYSHVVIQSIENKDGQYMFELMAFDNPNFENGRFNKEHAIPRWKSFGFTVKEVA